MPELQSRGNGSKDNCTVLRGRELRYRKNGQKDIDVDSGVGIHHIEKIISAFSPQKPSILKKPAIIISLIGCLIALITLVYIIFSDSFKEKLALVKEKSNTEIQLAIWRERTSKQIELLEKEVAEIKKIISHENRNIAQSNHQKEYIVNCYVGLMKLEYKDSDRTSFHLKYNIDNNVCEINELFDGWKKIGLPGRGDYLEIINSKYGKSTWAKVIGKFPDSNQPNWAVRISRKVKSDLFAGNFKNGIAMQVKLVKDPVLINKYNNLSE